MVSDFRGCHLGQASRRGSFEERKAQAIARKEEQLRIDREAFLQRQAERDAELDREYIPPERTGRPIGVVGTGGFGRGRNMMVMAAMLAATAGIGAIDIPSERKYR